MSPTGQPGTERLDIGTATGVKTMLGLSGPSSSAAPTVSQAGRGNLIQRSDCRRQLRDKRTREKPMATIIFHSMADSAYLWTAMLVAAEKGVSYELQPLTLGSPEHLKLHPFGKMPVMQHGDAILFETMAIAHYIDAAFDGPSLEPADALGQANMWRWIGMVNSYVFPTMNRFMKERLVKPLWGIETDKAFIETALTQLPIQMRLIDEATAGGKFLAGDSVSIADFFLFPHLLFFGLTDEGKAFLEAHGNAKAWLERMMARESFAQSPMNEAYRLFVARNAA